MAPGADEAFELIPGDPGKLYETVADLTQYADLMIEAGKGLRQIDVTSGWSGPAADAFRKAYEPQPSRWLQAGDAFRDSANAVDGYAQTLSWAQDQAAAAASLWDSGGHANQTQAQQILTNAQDQLESAGTLAASAVSNAASLAPPAPGFWSGIGHSLESLGSSLAHGYAEAIHDPLEIGGAALIIGGGALASTFAGAPLGTMLVAEGVGMTIAGAVRERSEAEAQNASSAGSYSPPAPTSAPEVAALANQLGFSRAVSAPQVPFHSGGQAVYTDGSDYITPDGDGWKLVDGQGNVLGRYGWGLTSEAK
jgi:hypothetical protein